MELHPNQLTKSKTNSKLLSLLNKRSHRTVDNKNNNWPGKHGPSLANFVIKRNN